MTGQTSSQPVLTDRSNWLDQRLALLKLEKEFSRKRDNLSAARRALPWVRVETEYTFATAQGQRSLAELFGPHSQLLVYHFMFGPDWEEGCKSCSFFADSFDKAQEHLAARDTAFCCASNAGFDRIDAYKRRMGWSFGWVSVQGNSFSKDFGVTFPDGAASDDAYNYTMRPYGEECPGLSVFCRLPDGGVAHSYSTYARGLDILNTTYNLLDHTPSGRAEEGLGYTMSWVERRDRY